MSRSRSTSVGSTSAGSGPAAAGDGDAAAGLARAVVEPASMPHGAAVRPAAWAALAEDGGARFRPVLQLLVQTADAPTRLLARRVLAMLEAAA
ncbi:hypothetical protein [Roseisolibacter sp. H3M3-2]|uniref:hypothetical protein n=1 Tax=Roseisolibacter sp. H3M3-2 TaxID=3031323 RepID=UPI0023D9B5E7|nr:hypothetical protein [Roseisolibacter sp. H3M3-2]MDF1504332.1 hypothetical protein [Roseisolibacter sp. H3M3-2]